jgi:nicotinate-nucleotide pyrophosphorylase (carboxylating)
MKLYELQYLPIVKSALREDLRSGDVTTDALIPRGHVATALMNFREAGVLCGIDIARAAFEEMDCLAHIETLMDDGARVDASAGVLRIEGEARAVLTAERVALNFVQRLSGIATLTQQFVSAIEGTSTQIVDTRKTTPGLRLLEKYAVRCGGGSNHRFALDDLILIKDNHVALCGGIAEAVKRAHEYSGHAVKIEVECDTLEQVTEAIEAKADIILLDNMTPQELKAAVQRIDGRAISEASGGVNLSTVRAIAQSGVDIISVGSLTHSARALDIGLDISL